MLTGPGAGEIRISRDGGKGQDGPRWRYLDAEESGTMRALDGAFGLPDELPEDERPVVAMLRDHGFHHVIVEPPGYEPDVS